MTLRRTKKRLKDGQDIGDHYSLEQVSAALIAADGHISKTAKKLKCTAKTVRQYLKRYPELEDLRDEIDEALIDLSESGLKAHIKGRNLDAIKFHLERKGKSRGYVKQTEIAGVEDKPIALTIVPATGYKDEEED
jgi:hypothetical protein